MDKLVLALHGSALAEPLSSESLRARLATIGVERLQINLDDEAVIGALRFGQGVPIAALVTLWLAEDADRAEVIGAIAEAAGEPDLHAYRVEERVRLDPTPMPDGERSEVYAQVALLRRPPAMSQEHYLAYWMLQHTPIAIRTQNTSAYIQNIVLESLTDSSPEIAAIVEEHFPMAGLTDPHAFYGSRGDAAELARRMSELIASVEHFGAGENLDLVPTSRYTWTL